MPLTERRVEEEYEDSAIDADNTNTLRINRRYFIRLWLDKSSTY